MVLARIDLSGSRGRRRRPFMRANHSPVAAPCFGPHIPCMDHFHPLVPLAKPGDERRVRRQFWGKLRRFAGRVPFADDAVAAYFCAIDRQTPARVRAVLIGALAYFIMPVDLVPDFIAGLGFTDDATVLMAAIAAVSPHIRPAHRERADEALMREARKGGEE